MGYIWNGWAHADLPAGSLGFVYLPALGIILLASVLAAPLGARLAHRLPISRAEAGIRRPAARPVGKNAVEPLRHLSFSAP
jgi:hypothetical protein